MKAYTRPREHFQRIVDYGSDTEWLEIAKESGLLSLHEIEFGRIDQPLLQAFVERWHPETNTFHFAWGEMSIMLHDVYEILKLQIDGESMDNVATAAARAVTVARVLEIDQATAIDLRKKSVSLLTADICGHMKKKAEGEAEPQWVPGYIDRLIDSGADDRHIVALLLFIITGSTLFVDKSTNSIRDWILSYLEQPRLAGRYAWGTVVLAYLYRELGIASRAGTTTIAGAVMLVQV